MMRTFQTRIPAWGRLLGLFFLCFSLVVGCNGNDPAVETGTGRTAATSNRVTIGTTLKPRTLDPADTYELSALGIIYNMSDRLYTYELDSTELKPQLATELPTVSEDGLTYTIPLREGVTFHDGTPFNAEAMKFSLDRFIENGGKPSFLLGDIVESVEATGEYELTIQLKNAFSAFPALLAFTGTAAVSPQAYEIGEGQFTPNTFVGTGPYQLTEFTSDAVRLDVFEDYWGEQPQNEGVDIQIYASNSANLYNSFRTGEVDVAYKSLDVDQIQDLLDNEETADWQVIEVPGAEVSYMALNTQQEPLNDVQVRRAVASLIDRDLFTQRALRGQSEPIYSMIPPSFEAYEPVFREEYGDVSPEEAQALLEEAGYSNDNPVVIEVWYPSGSASRNAVATTLDAYADQQFDGIIQFEPKSVESATFFGNIGNGLYPSSLVDWYPDFLDPDNYIHPFIYCSEGSASAGCQEGGAASQGSFYYNERVNELIDQQRREQDPEARQALLTEIQEIVAQDVPYIPLWQTKSYVFAQDGVTGVIISPSQDFPYWTIEK
jgi:peptide/nickel transport system substrate-binding protein